MDGKTPLIEQVGDRLKPRLTLKEEVFIVDRHRRPDCYMEEDENPIVGLGVTYQTKRKQKPRVLHIPRYIYD